MTALILATLLAASDGGTDVPLDTTYANPSAGVFVVESARQFDGGFLPDGWWLSRPRMQLLGQRISDAERERDAAHLAMTDTGWGFWAGVALGAVLTATAVTTVVVLIK